MASPDTIFALSSGRPPAAIAIVRISGTRSGDVLRSLAGGRPPSRMATLRTLRDGGGRPLDRALVLWFPAPTSATGEDVAELHCHGGAAVVRAVLRAIAALGLRVAEPGEFTRRALLAGRLDLDAVEALADLLAAETESQRREAILRSTGAVARRLADWAARLVALSATVEAAIDYDDSDDIAPAPPLDAIAALRDDIAMALSSPSAERLRDGVRVAIVGPVNAGKSSLFNALVGHDAAIVSDRPGTTRDIVERAIAIRDIAFILSDTAGLRESEDPIERIGIERARQADRNADMVLDLSPDAVSGAARIAIVAKADIAPARAGAISVSANTGAGLDDVIDAMTTAASTMLPGVDEATLQQRHRVALAGVVSDLDAALATSDLVLVAEYLSAARRVFVALGDGAGTEDMLDALFSRFCLGK